MNQVSLRHKKNTAPPQGGAPAAPQLSGGGVPNSAMAEAIGGGYQSNMSGLEANMNQRMQAIQHPAAGAGVVQQSVPLGTVQMRPRRSALADEFYRPEEEEYIPEVPREAPNWFLHPILYYRYKKALAQAQRAREAAERRRAEEQERTWATRMLKHRRNNKKAWQMTEADFAHNEFNPGDKDEITAIQDRIDEAETPEEAFQALAGEQGRLTFESEAARRQLDVNGQFKRRLKNMARMIVDYPELKNLVTDMHVREKTEETENVSMAAKMKYSSGRPRRIIGSELHYIAENGVISQYTPFGHNGTGDYSGNHELGHVLNGHLIGLKQQDRGRGYIRNADDTIEGITATSMLKKVIRKLFGGRKNNDIVNENGQKVDMRPRKERLGQNYDRKEADKAAIPDRIDINGSGFGRDFSASYGRTKPQEFFAEAFADVYANGVTAKKASIKLVEEYERVRNKLTRRIESRGQRAGI